MWSGEWPATHGRGERPIVDHYKKLVQLLDHMAAVSWPISPGGVASHIACFAYGYGQWLKVAGDDKAAVIEKALHRSEPRDNEAIIEFGAFVGYSSICLAAAMGASAKTHGMQGLISEVLSCEVDPVHAITSRSHIDLAGLSYTAEVVVGKLHDTIPQMLESMGEGGFRFVFMDQRGTAFHEDLVHLEQLASLGAGGGHVVADNTVKPGSPVYIWNLSRSVSHATTFWSMEEFGLP